MEAERTRRADPEDRRGELEGWLARARAGDGAALARELLSEREAWRRLPEAAQDLALACLCDALGAGWEALEARATECGGLHHRIGALRHERSGLRMLAIPGGRGRLGRPYDDPYAESESPQLEVLLPPFLIAEAPVTVAQWAAVMDDDRRLDGRRRPVTDVSWVAARIWLAKAGGGLRLPSEAEWEYAARAGVDAEFCFGDDPDPEGPLADFGHPFRGGRHALRPVGQGRPNAFGLRDVHGNGLEWVEDGWTESHESQPATAGPRPGGEEDWRVLKSSGLYHAPELMRCSWRDACERTEGRPDLGFRAARSVP